MVTVDESTKFCAGCGTREVYGDGTMQGWLSVSVYDGKVASGSHRWLGIFDTWLCLLGKLPEWRAWEQNHPTPGRIAGQIGLRKTDCVTCKRSGEDDGWAGWYRVTEKDSSLSRGYLTVALSCSIPCLRKAVAARPGIQVGVTAAYLAKHPDRVVDRQKIRDLIAALFPDGARDSGSSNNRSVNSERVSTALKKWEQIRWVIRRPEDDTVEILNKARLLDAARGWNKNQAEINRRIRRSRLR